MKQIKIQEVRNLYLFALTKAKPEDIKIDNNLKSDFIAGSALKYRRAVGAQLKLATGKIDSISKSEIISRNKQKYDCSPENSPTISRTLGPAYYDLIRKDKDNQIILNKAFNTSGYGVVHSDIQLEAEKFVQLNINEDIDQIIEKLPELKKNYYEQYEKIKNLTKTYSHIHQKLKDVPESESIEDTLKNIHEALQKDNVLFASILEDTTLVKKFKDERLFYRGLDFRSPNFVELAKLLMHNSKGKAGTTINIRSYVNITV